MAFSDRVLRYFGLQRTPVRRNYVGAQFNRLTLDWIKAPLSADKELDGQLPSLRARSRDLVRNNAFAKRFLRMVQNHVAGPYGVTLEAKNTSGAGRNAGRQNKRLNDQIEQAWAEWGRPETCTLSGRLSWVQVQRLVIGTVAQDGEALIQVVRGAENVFGFALHLIDPDQLDYTFHRRAGREGPEIRYGVEVDTYGRPLAYHLIRVHPSEVGPQRDRVRVPASDLLHLALLEDRVNLTRGVPWLAPAMTDLRHHAGYQEAELIAARTAAAKMAFIVTKDPNGDVATPDQGTQLQMDATPGTIEYLDLGQEVQSWDPAHPNGNFPEFSRTILRSIAAGLGVSYTGLSNDLREANYSSMKVGRAEEQDSWCSLQEWFISHFHERVFEAWLEQAMLAGRVQVPQFDLALANRVVWQPRRWVSVDPQKEIEANEKAIALGLTSRTRLAAGMGDDLEDIFEELKQEQAMAKEYGLTVGGVGNGKANANGATAADASGDGGAGSTDGAGGGGRARADFALVRTAG